MLLLLLFFVSKFFATFIQHSKHTRKHHYNTYYKKKHWLTLSTVSGGSKADVGGSAYESSYGTTRHSRYSTSQTEERVASNGNLNAVSSTTSATSYFAITGEDGVGKPVIKKTCKGVNIERKCVLWMKLKLIDRRERTNMPSAAKSFHSNEIVSDLHFCMVRMHFHFHFDRARVNIVKTNMQPFANAIRFFCLIS